MTALGCGCCASWDFDPVPLGTSTPRSKPRRLRALSCAGLAHRADEQSKSVNSDDEKRNVIAKGLVRFEQSAELAPQPDVEQLSERVLCVLGQNPSSYTLNGTNCYLVGTGPRRVLIDAGEEFFGGEAFMDCISQCFSEFGIEGLDAIVITHMHHDHYGNIGRLQEKYGPIPVYSKGLESFSILDELRRRGQYQLFIEDGEPVYNPKRHSAVRAAPDGVDFSWADSRVRHFPGPSTFARLQYIFFFTWHAQDLVERLSRGEYPWKPLQEGLVIQTEGATLQTIHMPGHSEDHMCFLLEEEHSLFSGDHVLGWGTTLIMDMKEYMTSLRRMLDLQPVHLYPGHGGHIKDGVSILKRYIEHREQRERQAWAVLSKQTEAVSIMDVVKELYPETPAERLWMASGNVEVLFRKFVADGAALALAPDESSKLTPLEVPSSYKVRNLPGTVRWVAKRSLAKL